MHDFIQFVATHWVLWLTLIFALLLLLREEGKGGQGGSLAQSPQGVVQKMNASGVVYDLRGQTEYAKEHILNAKVLDGKALLRGDLPKLPANLPVVFCCDDGRLSSMIAMRASKGGHKDVSFIHGGLRAWREAALPLTNEEA